MKLQTNITTRLINYITKNWQLIFTLSVFGLWLLYGFSTFSHPHIDLFPMIEEGQQIYNLQIPFGNVYQPGYSLLIVILGKVVFSFFPNPEISAAIIVNVIASTWSLILLYHLLKSTLKKFTIIPILALATNLHYLESIIVCTNTPLLLWFYIFWIYCYQTNKSQLGRIVAVIAYFFRVEGIILLACQIIAEKSSLKAVIRTLFLFLSLFVGWFLVTAHTQEASQLFNFEVVRAKLSLLPNQVFLRFSLLPFAVSNYIDTYYLSSKIIVLLVSLVLTINIRQFITSQTPIKFFFIELVIYTLIHTLFPEVAPRFFFITQALIYIMLTYLMISNQNQPFFYYSIKIFLITIIVFNFFISMIALANRVNLYHRGEYGLLLEWIENTDFPKPSKIITFEGCLPKYYSKKNNVLISVEIRNSKCSDEKCIINELNTNAHNQETYIAIDSYSISTRFDNEYFHRLHKISFFKWANKYALTNHLTPVFQKKLGSDSIAIYKLSDFK